MRICGNIKEDEMSERDRTEGYKFLTEYLNAYIGQGAKRFQTMVPLDYQDIDFDCFQKGEKVDFSDRKIYTEESIDISLRESDYQRLLDILGYIQHHGNADFYHKDLESKIAFERSLREKYPGIKKAYKNYRVLLDMVAKGKDIEDT